MSAWPPKMAGSWLSSSSENISENMLVITNSNARHSVTMELDQSQPPTPDGTGLPANFSSIGPGIYRASYPQAAHFSALEPLKVKTIVTFVTEDISADYQAFITKSGITHHRIHVLANKDPDIFTDDKTVNEVIKLMLDRENHPILIHCNKGKHRTGCITACFRKVTGWTLEACIAEYEDFSLPKDRPLDKAFITRFDASALKSLALERGFVGGAFAQPYVESSNDSEYTNNTFVSEDSGFAFELGF